MTGKEITDEFVEAVDVGVDVIREKDIQFGAMNENWEPANHHLSAEENEHCWKKLASIFIIMVMKACADAGECLVSDDDHVYSLWLTLLEKVEGVVRHGQKNKGIESIINHSDISRKTLIKFLDSRNITKVNFYNAIGLNKINKGD